MFWRTREEVIRQSGVHLSVETGMMDGGGAAGEAQRLSTGKQESSLPRQHHELKQPATPEHTHGGWKQQRLELMLRP